ncbi:MAG: hypothetical protein ACLP8S_07060 [Solirubrobacteraceae bacterium]
MMISDSHDPALPADTTAKTEAAIAPRELADVPAIEIPWVIRTLCRWKPAAPKQVAHATTQGANPDPEGIAALLEIANSTADDERQRGQILDSKMATFVGAIGLILSVNVTFGQTLLDAKLGHAGHDFILAFFALTVVALFLALIVGILGVLSPQKYRSLLEDQIRGFTSSNTQAMTRVQVHQSMLGAVANILRQDRPMNDCKATLTKIVASLLVVGFVGVAGEAITLALHSVHG